MNTSFSQIDILECLERDDKETHHFFIEFEHPYFHTASTRLTLFADKYRWALVFEKSGYSNTGFRGEIEVVYFGNCLINLKNDDDASDATSNMKIVPLISNAEIERIEKDLSGLIHPEIRQIRVRDSLLDIEQDKSKYLAKDIGDPAFDNEDNLIDIPSLIRYLAEEHPTLFRATDEELRQCLPGNLPMLMHIDHWHHEPYYLFDAENARANNIPRVSGIKPSDNETYKMIANILVQNDTTKWVPSSNPNNDWRNWPNAGYM